MRLRPVKVILLLAAAIVSSAFFLPRGALADGSYMLKDVEQTPSDPASRADKEVFYRGFVPCGLGKPLCTDSRFISGGACGDQVYTKAFGKEYEGVSCQFCHFFVMFNGIVHYVLIDIVPYLAALIIVIGGAMFYFAGANPSLLAKAKKLLIGVLIGLFLIYGSYMIVGLFLDVLGVTTASGLADWARNGWTVECPISAQGREVYLKAPPGP